MQFSSLSLHCRFPFSIPLPQFSLADGSKGPLVLAGRCRLPGSLSRTACQAFQGSFSLSRGWKCRAGDRLPWQPHCFQTLKGRERKVCFSRLTKATTMDAGQVRLKITAVLPDTRASRGQSRTMHPGPAGTEQSRAEGELGAFSSIPLSPNKAACVVPAVLVNSNQGRLSRFVFTGGLQPVQLRVAANCLFPAGNAKLPIVLTCVNDGVGHCGIGDPTAQGCPCLKVRSPSPPTPPPGHVRSAGIAPHSSSL